MLIGPVKSAQASPSCTATTDINTWDYALSQLAFDINRLRTTQAFEALHTLISQTLCLNDVVEAAALSKLWHLHGMAFCLSEEYTKKGEVNPDMLAYFEQSIRQSPQKPWPFAHYKNLCQVHWQNAKAAVEVEAHPLTITAPEGLTDIYFAGHEITDEAKILPVGYGWHLQQQYIDGRWMGEWVLISPETPMPIALSQVKGENTPPRLIPEDGESHTSTDIKAQSPQTRPSPMEFALLSTVQNRRCTQWGSEFQARLAPFSHAFFTALAFGTLSGPLTPCSEDEDSPLNPKVSSLPLGISGGYQKSFPEGHFALGGLYQWAPTPKTHLEGAYHHIGATADGVLGNRAIKMMVKIDALWLGAPTLQMGRPALNLSVGLSWRPQMTQRKELARTSQKNKIVKPPPPSS